MADASTLMRHRLRSQLSGAAVVGDSGRIGSEICGFGNPVVSALTVQRLDPAHTDALVHLVRPP